MKKPEILNIIEITPVLSFFAIVTILVIGHYAHSFAALKDLILAMFMLGPVIGIIYGITLLRKKGD